MLVDLRSAGLWLARANCVRLTSTASRVCSAGLAPAPDLAKTTYSKFIRGFLLKCKQGAMFNEHSRPTRAGWSMRPSLRQFGPSSRIARCLVLSARHPGIAGAGSGDGKCVPSISIIDVVQYRHQGIRMTGDVLNLGKQRSLPLVLWR